MTIRIKFTISEGGRFGSSTGKVVRKGNSINIELDTLNRVHIQDEVDNRDVENFRNQLGVLSETKEIKKLEIVLSNEIETRKVYGLLHLKHKLKEGGEPWDFIINRINYDKNNANARLKLDDVTDILTLNIAEFSNNLDNVDISNLSFTNGISPVLTSFNGDFKNNRSELYKLEDLLVNLRKSLHFT